MMKVIGISVVKSVSTKKFCIDFASHMFMELHKLNLLVYSGKQIKNNHKQVPFNENLL